MLPIERSTLCGVKLRAICMAIGYLHLVSSIVDICCHVYTVGIITGGFQCDVNSESLQALSNTQSLEPVLLLLNLGTHGFYPFPHIIKNQFNTYVEYMAVSSTPRCYPGVLHVYIIDVLSFVVNLIWLNFVINYVKALHKRDHESMRVFVSLFLVKLIMQIMFMGYYPMSFAGFMDFQTYWALKVMDSIIAFFLFMIIHTYAKVLRAQILEPVQVEEKPPSYFECLIGMNQPVPPAADTTKAEKNGINEEVKKEDPKETV